ncbi:hypothetical protein, partial [Pseudomonas aeruginosa]|uniref:hypothetical protein n=1 Tax=Pseudomonas aeruginosa TaxID=287 RepID=UPI001ABCA579
MLHTTNVVPNIGCIDTSDSIPKPDLRNVPLIKPTTSDITKNIAIVHHEKTRDIDQSIDMTHGIIKIPQMSAYKPDETLLCVCPKDRAAPRPINEVKSQKLIEI